MKVLPFKIPKKENIGLLYNEDREQSFYNKFHQHEDIQLSIIVKGEGTLVVGDTIHTYTSGTIVFIDSNLPHVFKSDDSFTEESFMISLFFTYNSFGKNFFLLDDFKELHSFFDNMKQGALFTSKEKTLRKLFLQLIDKPHLERFVLFFEILNTLQKATYKPLSSFVYPKKYSKNEGKRMQSIIEFTMNNFQNDVSLTDIANVANMTTNAFCRYFKLRTNKTYVSFLNELRIEKICKLLENNREKSINEIAYECGFKNISNFNRQFKYLKGVSPSNYRKR